MARRIRLHVRGGVYFVVQETARREPFFPEPSDYAAFEALLETALRRTSASALAYCWLPNSIHVVLRIQETPLGRLMQGFTSRYARRLHARTGECGHLFPQRYRAVLIEPEAWLPKLIRYIHYLPVCAGLAPDPLAYRHSSHRAYLNAGPAWVSTSVGLRILRTLGEPRAVYRKLMSCAPPDEDVLLFKGGADNSILGSPQFMVGLPRQARTHRTGLSLDQIIKEVAMVLGVSQQQILSKGRQHDLALARALIAWHATERNVASLSEVARRVGRDPSTLSVGIARHRTLHPDLFTLNALRHLTPLA